MAWGREAIEWFEVGYAAGRPALWWRGCAVLPPHVWANDVVARPNAGPLATHMIAPPDEGWRGLWSTLRLVLGATTGEVLVWSGEGWSALPGSEGSGPNGVAVAEDGAVFLTEWGGQRLVRVAPDGTRSVVDLGFHPDNLTWTKDGLLLVAGQNASLGTIFACLEIESGTCGLPFTVMAVEPASLSAETVVRHDARVTGAASVALEVGENLFLGTFAGDRVTRLEYRHSHPLR